MQGHKAAVYDFVLDKNSRTVYSAGADGLVVAWDLNRPENGNLILQAEEAFYSISKHGDLIKAGSRNGVLFTVDVVLNKLIEQKQVHEGGIFFINEKGSGGEDGNFNEILNSKLKIPIGKDSLRCCLEWGGKYIIGSSDNSIYILNKETLVIDNQLYGHENSVFALELLDDQTLVSAGRDAHLKVWDLTIQKEVHSVPAHNYQIKSLSFNGTHLLSSSMDKTIKIWNDKLELQKVIDFERNESHTNCINKVEWLDENMFVSCSDDRSLILWKVE